MTMYRFGLLFAVCMHFAVACQPGDRPTGAGEVTVTPTRRDATPTAPPDANEETAVAATPTLGSEDGTAEAEVAGADAADPEAADAAVLFVQATEDADGSWTFRVTVSHPDTGWDDYADGWDVVTPGGTVLKPNADDAFTRVLLHPHENEQPFTRSQRGIVIPEGVNVVTVRAHDSVDGFGGRDVRVDLEAGSGPDFEVERQP